MHEIMDVLINSVGAILSKSIHMSNPNIIYFKYLLVLLVNYISINLDKKRCYRW